MDNMPRVSVVVPAFNAQADYKVCLDSLARQTYSNCEVLWIDSASSDGSADAVAREFPGVELLRLDKNLGYRGGVRIGCDKAKGDMLLICNQDVELELDCIEKLVICADLRPTIGMVAPLMLLFDQRELVNEAGNVFHFTGLYGSQGLYEKAEAYREPINLGAVSGGCFLIGKQLWGELEGFSNIYDCHDTGWHAGMEDFDLSWRTLLSGREIVLCPDARLYHKYSPKGWSGVRLNSLYFSYLVTGFKNFEIRSLVILAPLTVLFCSLACGRLRCWME